MRLTASLLTYNSGIYAERCLESLMQQTGLGTLGNDWKIVVLDNASTDHAFLSEIETHFPKIAIIRGEENLGFGKGHNRIMQSHPSDYHAILNIDVLFAPDFLSLLIASLEKNTQYGSAVGKLLRWNLEAQPEKSNIIDSMGIARTVWNSFYDLGQGELDRGQYDRETNCFGGSGAAVVYRRMALESVAENGKFYDDKMFMYKEDIDLALRLSNADHPCISVSAAKAWHDRTAASVIRRKNRSQRERILSATHEVYILRKHWSTFAPSLKIRTILRQCLRWTYLLIREPRVFFGSLQQYRTIAAL